MTDSLTSSDVEQIVRLIESLDNSAFDYLELRVGDLKVTIGKGEPPATAAADPVPAPATSPVAPQVLPAPPAITPAPVAVAPVVTAPIPTASAGSVAITAPTMGIFYAQSGPGKPPFVTVGALVEESTTVALVEVMKTFHAVSAGVRGTVVEVCVQDAQLVEFGQVLYRVEPVVG